MSKKTTRQNNDVQSISSPAAKVSQQAEKNLNQSRLEELQELTGCPITLVIEGRCQEEDCPNAERWLTRGQQEKTEYIRRVQKIARLEVDPQPEPHQTAPEQPMDFPQQPAPIFDTRPRMRCIL